jgi:subtilisin family serine protease
MSWKKILPFVGALLLLMMISMGVTASRQEASLENVYVRVQDWDARDAARLGIVPQMQVDYDSFFWMALSSQDFARLSEATLSFEVIPAPYQLTLAEQQFDPVRDQPVINADWASAARASGPDFQLIQLVGPTKDDWLATLEADGYKVLQYIEPFTYVVWGSSDAADRAVEHSFVRWRGDFVPAFRVQPALQADARATEDMHITIYRGAGEDAVILQLENLGAVITSRGRMSADWEIVAVTIPGTQLNAAAAIPGVYSIQPVSTGDPARGEVTSQINVGNIDSSNYAVTGYKDWLASVGLDGSGVVIANVDGGVYETHNDLKNRFISCVGSTCSTTGSTHGTHTAGIMAGDGSSGSVNSSGFLRGLGVAPGANLIEQDYCAASFCYNQANGLLILIQQSYSNTAVLSGNSWGPAGTPKGYDDDTKQVDIGVRDADPYTAGNQQFTYVLSIMNGNGGTSSQGSPDEAKNIFTIGSTWAQINSNSQYTKINDISSNSAHGPALDGRVIPHLVAPGCNVDSSYTSVGYNTLCGTSMASPQVSGGVALFFEFFRNLTAARGAALDPSPALVKAAFLPVAHDLAGNKDADNGTLGHPFDNKQGWGRMDLAAVVDPKQQVLYYDAPVTFDNTGEDWEITIQAENQFKPVRLMLVWTDAPGHGSGGSTPAWVNNLDLVVAQEADTYKGNVFGSDGWSVTGGSADGKNNTEGIFLPAFSSGVYTVTVDAINIAGDAIPNTGDGTDQDFSLVCYNCELVNGDAPIISFDVDTKYYYFPLIFR